MTRVSLLRPILTPAVMLAMGVLLPGGWNGLAAQSVAGDSVRAVPASVPAPGGPDLSALRPGDVLRLRIWREPDLSGDFPVDEAGQAILPRLGPTPVVGVPAEQLKQRLTAEYQKYLNNPSIEVTPLRRVAILGAVRNPGIYPIDPSITLGQAPNVAGGAMPSESKRNMLELRRDGVSRVVDLKQHPALAGLPLASGDQVYIPERSWFSRNATWVVSTAIGVAGTTALLLTR